MLCLVLIRIDYLYSVVYCDHVGTLSIVYLVRKSEFVLQYLRDEGENEWVVCNLETLVKKEGSIRNKEESQQKDDAGNKKKGEKRRKSRTCAAAFFLSLAPRCFHFCHLTRRMREKKREKLSHVLCDFQSQLVQVILCTTRQGRAVKNVKLYFLVLLLKERNEDRAAVLWMHKLCFK